MPDTLRDFFLLRDAVAVMVIQRELTGAQDAPEPGAVEHVPRPLIRRALSNSSAAAGVRLRANRISFPRHLLDLPLPRANPHSAQLCELQCQALLAKRQVRSGLAGQIRDRLLSTPGRLADME